MINKKSLRIFSITICLALVVGLVVGCGSKTTTPTSDSEDTSSKQELDYPKGPITVIVPFPPGGGHDLTARVMVPHMNDQGFQMVVQNIEGSGGIIGSMEAYNGKADGYTVLMSSPEVLANQYVSGMLDLPLFQEFIYIGNFVYDAGIICVSGDAPYDSLEELIDAAKENPGQLKWASVGANGKNHMEAMNLFKLAGADFNYVPYEGAAKSRAAVLGGHADVYHAYISEGAASVESGELKALAVACEERVELLPDVPTLKELGFDTVFGLTRCWAVYPDTPQEIVEALSNAMKVAFENEAVQEAFIKMYANPYWMSTDELRDYGKTQYEIYNEMSKLLE